MPEGDSIHRSAAALGPRLVGQPLVAVHVGGVHHERLAGLTVTGVAATGKHLTIDLDGGEWQLRVHLGMNGRWRKYPPGTPPPASASLIMTNAGGSYACLNAPTVELTPRRSFRRGVAVAALGPDLLLASFDPAAAAPRAHAAGHVAIGVVLLDQRVVAGIGNIFKSESLFLERISPLAPAASLSLDALTALYARAHHLMRASLTRRRLPFQVYRRAGRPCPRCGTRITTIRQGTQLRTTYYCPRCQALPSASP
jgi:endonuclease-8